MAEVTMVAALNAALRDALAGDPRTLVFGEDVGALGGVFRVTEGLQAEFGGERVFDTPIAEAGIAGICVGLAMAGWRPIAEMQFDGFSYPALDQVISHLAKYRERTRGRVGVPAVIRIPSFGGIRGKEHHGESPETYYVHTAGLKVVVPSTPLDAYRLLRRSIDDPDPVIFLEPKSRYWSKEDGDLTAEGPGIGRARVVREGGACVLIAYGAMVGRCLEAATALAADGIETTVLDLRSLVPLDVDGDRRRRPVDRTRGRRARGTAHPRDGRRDRGADRRGGVRPPRGAGRAGHGPGRAVPAGVARAALPPERRTDLERRPHGGGLLMAERVFTLPDLGEGLEEAIVSAWLVAEGDTVSLNQPFVEIETAKATVEVPAPFAGRVARLHVAAGETLAVGAPLATFEVEGGGGTGGRHAGSSSPASSVHPDVIGGDGSPASAPARPSVAATPAVRKLAKDLGVDLSMVSGSGPGGRSRARTSNELPANRRRVRRMRSRTGEHVWRVTVSTDVEAVPVSLTRRAIADRLSEVAAIPQVTTFRTVDCTALEAVRARLGRLASAGRRSSARRGVPGSSDAQRDLGRRPDPDLP